MDHPPPKLPMYSHSTYNTHPDLQGNLRGSLLSFHPFLCQEIPERLILENDIRGCSVWIDSPYVVNSWMYGNVLAYAGKVDEGWIPIEDRKVELPIPELSKIWRYWLLQLILWPRGWRSRDIVDLDRCGVRRDELHQRIDFARDIEYDIAAISIYPSHALCANRSWPVFFWKKKKRL